MRVKRTTGALQPREQSARPFPVKRHKRSIFRTVLSGAAAVGLGLALMTGTAPQPVWADDAAADQQTVAYTATAEMAEKARSAVNGDVKVTVDAPEGALPDGAELQAKLLSDDADTQAVADELDKAGVDYDGFAAMDISFVDADGNEVEPTEAVDVKIELPEGVVPEDADTSTLAVQHLSENEDGEVEKVDAVADAGDATQGTVETTDDKATADFTVDSFSMFTITWTAKSGWREDLVQITATCLDADDNSPLDDGPLNLSFDSGDTVYFSVSNQSLNIDGYTFEHAEYYSNGDWRELSSLRAIGYYNDWSWGGWSWSYLINGQNGSINANRGIRLYYKKNSTTPPEPPEPISATVTTGKSAVLDEQTGNYTLNLSVSGDRGSQENKQKVDVLFILDESNSMMDNWGNTNRLTAARNAIGQITGATSGNGLSQNAALDVNYALVGFYGGEDNRTWNDASTLQSWTSSASVLYNSVPSWLNDGRSDGGTNYEAGFMQGKQVLNSSRSDALKVVIFISDGNPGYYYNDNGYTAGMSNPTSTNYSTEALSQGAAACAQLDTDYFYFVGVTNSVAGNVFSTITNSSTASTKASYSSNSTSDLLQAFANIQQQLTYFQAHKVTMTDPLSQYADLVPNEDGSYTFTLNLEQRPEGGSAYSTVATQTVTVSAGRSANVTLSNGQGGESVPLTVSLDGDADTAPTTITVKFADGYKLAQNYRYTVSTTITPSQEAINTGMDSSAAKQTPDTGTGTHADNNEQGFWSNNNDGAKVDFTPISTDESGNPTGEGDPDSENFPKPVIQVKTKSLTVDGLFTVNKVVNNHDLATGQFDFMVTAVDATNADGSTTSASEAAQLAGFDGMSETLGNTGSASAGQSGVARTGKQLTFTSSKIGKTYAFRYSEVQTLDQSYQGEDQTSDYTFDQNVYQVELTPSLNDDGELEVTMKIFHVNVNEDGTQTKGGQIGGDIVYSESSKDKKGSITFYNTYNPLGLRITKTNADGSENLEGAYFVIYGADEEGSMASSPLDTIYSSTALDDQHKQGADGFKTGSDGLVTFYNLQRGQTYYVKEITMPAGYEENTNTYRIVIDDKGIATLTQIAADKTETTLEMGTDTSGANTVYTMSLANTKVTDLPQSGSSGTLALTTAGVAIAAMAGYALYRNRCPQR